MYYLYQHVLIARSLFIKGARIVEYAKLQEIVGDYQQLNYAKGAHRGYFCLPAPLTRPGAIELPLYCAEVADSQGQGRDFWHAGCPVNDSRLESWERRRRCYDLVLDSLGVFESKAAAAASGHPVVDDPEAVRAHAYELAFLSEDEMFHSTLYDWLIGKGLADELLEVWLQRMCSVVKLFTPRLPDATGISRSTPSKGTP